MSALVRLHLWHDPSLLHLVRPVADMMRAAGLEPRLRTGCQLPRETDAIVVLLGSSPRAPCWVDADWVQAVFEPAIAARIPVLPISVEDCPLPEALAHLSHADFVNRDREAEEHRFLTSLARLFGTDRIRVPRLTRDIPTSAPRHAIRLRHGAALGPLIADGFVAETVPMMQDGLFHELGVPFPDVHAAPDAGLTPMAFAVDLFESEEVSQAIPDSMVFVNAHPDALRQGGYDCEPATNPANGHLFAWVDENHADVLAAKGLTTWDARGWLVLCLSSLLRYRASTFLDQTTVAAMLDRLRPHFPRLVETTVPGALSLGRLTDVLRRLVLEGVPVGNLRRILIEVAEIAAYEDRPDVLADYVRASMKDLITHRFSRGQGHVVVILIAPELEARLRAAIEWGETSSWIALGPEELAPLLEGLGDLMARLGPGVQAPVILTQLELRAAVRRLIAQRFPAVHVIAYNDLEPTINIQPVGRIDPGGASLRAGVSVGDIAL